MTTLGVLSMVSLITADDGVAQRARRMSELVGALVRGTALGVGGACLWLSLRFGSLGSGALSAVVLSMLSFIGFTLTRTGTRTVRSLLTRRGQGTRNVLIVGSNRRAVALAETMESSPSSPYQLVGFADDVWHFAEAPEHFKRMLLGGTRDTLELLRTLALDEVIIALPIASTYQMTEQIIAWCRQQGILVRSEGRLFDAEPRHAPANSSPKLITHHDRARGEWSIAGKRTLDVLLSGSAITLLLPVFAAVAIAVRLSSSGPILFRQERLGLNKRRFRILKFRTMVTNAEKLMAEVEHLNQSEGPTFKLLRDPRITGCGAFLRKTSLDELPQLLNVLLGDMSLVGPRPLPLRDYNGFSKDWHRRRFSVKPGITCLWQVNGRSSIGFERWMELDVDYVDRWSLGLDLRILLQTIPTVLRGSGAM